MADDMEPVLRNALDAVNTGRKWTMLGITALFFAITIALASLFSAAAGAARAADVPATPLKAMWVSATAQMLLMACSTALVMMHVSRTTRVILRAIEAMRR